VELSKQMILDYITARYTLRQICSYVHLYVHYIHILSDWTI